jgi:2',3'-cyclic-nucleotide 2'-phosphodiesterase/3'-nucleotidase
MIAWVKAKGSIDPAAFAAVDWKLTREGTPVF